MLLISFLSIFCLFSIALSQSNQFFSSPPSNEFIQQRTMDKIFDSYPKKSEVVQKILNADVLGLSKLLQLIEIKSHESHCQIPIFYTNEVIGMINTGRYKFEKLKNTYKENFQKMSQEIVELYNQEKMLKSEKNELKISEKKRLLEFNVKKSNNSLSQYQNSERSILPIQAQILGKKKQLQFNKINAELQRQKINFKKVSVVDLNSEIDNLQQSLSILKKQRQSILHEIGINEGKLQQYETKIENAKKQISKLEEEIFIIKKNMLSLKEFLFDAEVTIDRLTTQIAISQLKENSFVKNLEAHSQKIKKLKQKLSVNQKDYRMATEKSKVLQSFMKMFSQKNNDLYYKCYAEKNYFKQSITNSTIYFLSSDTLRFFLSRNYGKKVSLPSVNYSKKIGFEVANIFGQEWEDEYGLDKSEENEDKFFKNKEFICMNPSKMVSGNGRILNIEKNMIWVSSIDKRIWLLRLEGCSRLQTITKIPKIDQIIYFKGVKLENNIIRTYMASVF